MILLHHPEVELSRNLLALLPDTCGCVDWTNDVQREEYSTLGGLSPSALPSVVVDVPAYAEDRAQFGQDGEFLGMARVIVEAHEEVLRMPGSWQAVESFVAFAEARANT